MNSQNPMELLEQVSSPAAAIIAGMAWQTARDCARRLDQMAASMQLPPLPRRKRPVVPLALMLCIVAAAFGWGCKMTSIDLPGIGTLSRRVPFPMSDDFRVALIATNGTKIDAGIVTSSADTLRAATELVKELRSAVP